MGVEVTTTVHITCDNPACPGNSLDPASYDGWIKLVATVTPTLPEGSTGYAFPIMQEAIYCSSACSGSVTEALDAAEEARKVPPPEPVVDQPEPEARTTRTRAKKS